MNGVVLITGKQSGFTDDLVQEALNRKRRVFATHDADDTPPEVPDTTGDNLTYVPWSRRSLLSARSALLTVSREADEAIDHVICVCSPEGVTRTLHEIESAEIEVLVDNAVKGYLFIVKEAIAALLRQGAGSCSLVWYDGGADLMPPLDAAVAGAMQALMQSLLLFYQNEPIGIRGFLASDSDSRGVAQWVVEHALDRTQKSDGRMLKYGQKGFLPFRR